MTAMAIIDFGLGMGDRIIDLASTSDTDKLMDKMVDLSRKMESFEQNLGLQMMNGFANLRRELHTQTQLSNQFQILNDQIDRISGAYIQLKQYANRTMAYETFTLNNFATKCVSPDDDGTMKTIEKLHFLIKPNRDGYMNQNLLELIADHLKSKINTTQCSDKQSHQYLLYDLFNPIVIAEIRGLALMEFSYKLLTLAGRGNFRTELRNTRSNYQTRLNETLDAFREAMLIASPDVWRCDPPTWTGNTVLTEGDDSYTELHSSWFNYFNKRNVTADIGSNKVITGIRIVKNLRMLHLQIEQGELLPQGKIANITEWIAPEVYHVEDPNRSEGIDWVHLPNYGMGIELNDVTAPHGHCLTGVRFGNNQDVTFEIMTTPFNFTTGKLIDPLRKSQWRGYDATTRKTRMVPLDIRDKPTRSGRPSISNFGINEYIMPRTFTTESDPTQSVAPRVALGGAGIFYKGSDGYGGFIAPKLKTYNFGPHLHPVPSISDLYEDRDLTVIPIEDQV